MHKIIFDCDNTMGLLGKDVDDGLTLLYLLGRKDIDLLGITTTHGNSNVDETFNQTVKLLNDLGLKKPIFEGGDINNRISDASIFLSETVEKYRNQITILATGSMTNIYGAYLYDNEFYNNLKNIVIMGGLTKPLNILGYNIDELNLSCDYEAAFNVLTSKCDLTILTGNTTSQALFSESEIEKLKNSNLKIYKYIYENIKDWVNLIYSNFKIKAFCNWDAAAAIFITNPELFELEEKYIDPNIESLKKGFIDTKDTSEYKVKIPNKILNINKFNELLFDSWKNLELNL